MCNPFLYSLMFCAKLKMIRSCFVIYWLKYEVKMGIAAWIPIEVKASSGKTKSMKTLIDSEKYPDICYGFKFSANNIGHENRIYTFPYFCTFLLKRFMQDFHPEEEQLSC